MRTLVLSAVLASSFGLGGCAASMAASAVGMAVQAAQGPPRSNAHLAPTAAEACSARAAEYGTVHIIDVEQRGMSKLVVWGTVDDGKERRSFECSFGTKITGFKLRPIQKAG